MCLVNTAKSELEPAVPLTAAPTDTHHFPITAFSRYDVVGGC